MKRITPNLWFDSQAEEAANFYVSIFPNSKITEVTRYPEAGKEVHGREPGSVMTVSFELDGLPFIGLNGGPLFKFSEAISFLVPCETQEEIDHYWSKLSEGGKEVQCGWLTDKFGLSWQIAPTRMDELMKSGNQAQRNAVMGAMMKMVKFDIAQLQEAYDNA